MKKTNLFTTAAAWLLAIFILPPFVGIDGGGLHAQNYQWAKNIGSTMDDYGRSIAIDASGNVYITGRFQGTADFDPGAGTANLTAVGAADIFFAKYDSSGTYQWAKNIGSTSTDYGYSIAVDASGNVYITGSFYGTADFDPGAGTANLTFVGGDDIFFAKYDSSGTYQWAKSIGSTNGDKGFSIAVDTSGNVYITGYFTGAADFDPGAGTANLTPVFSADIFFAKYDNSGTYQWAKNIGSTNDDVGYNIAVDASGNVYITGLFYGAADFDPGAGTANLTPVGNRDIFFAKYDSSGVYQWAKNIGSTIDDIGYSIAVDASSNVYITGYFNGTVDFDPGAGTANLTGNYNIFFAKYDSSGTYSWAKNIGSTGIDNGYSIAVDASGNVYITGLFYGAADFDPGAGTANLTSVGGDDIFFAKYDSSGTYSWAKNIGSTSDDVGYSIAVDASGNVYITGSFADTADFDPGAGTANLTPVGSADIFFAKYSQQLTGINNQYTIINNQLKVYPNPGRGVFTLSTNYEFYTNIRIVVYDMLGREVYKTQISPKGVLWTSPKTQAPRSEFEIDLSGQQAGVYHLQIITDSGIAHRKVVIE